MPKIPKRKMDFVGIPKQEGDPITPEEGIKKIGEIAKPPEHSIVLMVVINIFFFALVSIPLLAYSKFNIFTIIAVIMAQISYAKYCQKKIPSGYIGLPRLFGFRNAMWSWVYGEGDIFVLRPFQSVSTINMGRRVLDLHDDKNDHEFAVNAASGKNKKSEKTAKEAGADPSTGGNDPTKQLETEVVPMLIDAFAEWQIWNPWRIESVGEEVIERGLANHIIASIRDAATDFTESEMRGDKNSLEETAQKAADEKTDEYGIWVREIPIRNVRPSSERVVQAHESVVIERRRSNAAAYVLKGVREFNKFGLKPLDAVMAYDDGAGRAHNRRQVIVSNGGGETGPKDPHSLLPATVINSWKDGHGDKQEDGN